MTITQLLNKFFEVRDQIHYWHLQTKSYAEHKILNEFYEKWLEFADRFIETYQGRYPYIEGIMKIELGTYSKNGSQAYLKAVLLFLQSDARKLIYAIDTDLAAVLDEMQGLVSQTIYLLNMQ
jgi:hypothetical protein